MRHPIHFIYSLLLIALLTACAPIAPGTPPAAGVDATETTTGDAPFPVTIEHKYGSTTITEKPERIVTAGLTDHDALLALGIVPIGTSE